MTVKYSIQKMVSDGTLSTIALGIQYLQRNDIYIRIAGEETPQSGAPSGYTWSFLDNTTLKILPVVPNGVEVVVYRGTDVDAMYNIYSQNAQFDEATIDENNQQLLYIAQEYLEQGLPGAGVDTIEFLRDDGTNTYYRIKRTDGSYSDEFTVPSASSSTKVLTREALRRSYAEAGYNLVDGSFEAGGTLVNANDVLLQERTGKAFSGPAGTYHANTNPALGSFVDRSGLLPGAGVVRNDKFALRDLYSVKDFGATGLGLVDESAAFSLAAINTPAINNIPGNEGSGMPRAPMCRILVPEGTYLLTALVDTGNKAVIWDVDANAKIIGAEFINGEIYRAGIRHSSGLQHGSTDYACGTSLKVNIENDDGAEVLGVSSPSALGKYASRDSVAMYVSNTAPDVLASFASCTYTATTVTTPGLTPDQLKKIRKGMIIDTSEPRATGVIESWNTDGTVITVSGGWYAVTGEITPPIIPANGLGCNINVFTKIWAHNANVLIPAQCHATSSTGFELGLLNYKSDTLSTWGFDSVNLGPKKGGSSFIARGDWRYGFHCRTTAHTGFYYQGSGMPFEAKDRSESNPFFAVFATGSMELGNGALNGGLWYADIHSSQMTYNDYDARIQVAGGGDTKAGATVSFACSTLVLGVSKEVIAQNHIRPGADNVYDFGNSAHRGRTAYFGTGVINTSDAREKTAPLPIDGAVLDAWADVQLIAFQWLDAIQTKGEDVARWHFGVIAQQVRDAFIAHGLDGTRYGLLCYDEWGDEFGPVYGTRFNPETEKNEPFDTGEVELVRAAGNRWGIRADQCLFLEAAYQRRRCDRIEARLKAAGL